MVYRLFDSLTYRAHGNYDPFGIRCSHIVERLVASSCHLADLIHVFHYDLRYCIVESVGCFSSLEEYVRVLCRTSDDRVLRIQRSFSEFLQCLPVYQLLEIIVAEHFDLLDLM